MKFLLYNLFLLMFANSVFSQELRFFVHGKNARGITKESLSSAKTLIDLLPGYPSGWISSYNSVELFVKQNGKTSSATGSNEILNQEQFDLLKSAELNSELKIEVKYDYSNPLTKEVEKNNISVVLTVLPESEAKFIGGEKELNKYLMENCNDKIAESAMKSIRRTSVKFIVNEEGQIIKPNITLSSGNEQIDQLLIETLSNMPKWIPAENAEGIKVQQEFVMDMNQKGSGGC